VEEFISCVLWDFKKSPILSITLFVIDGHDSFSHVEFKSQKGGGQPEQVGLSPLVTPHFTDCVQD